MARGGNWDVSVIYAIYTDRWDDVRTDWMLGLCNNNVLNWSTRPTQGTVSKYTIVSFKKLHWNKCVHMSSYCIWYYVVKNSKTNTWSFVDNCKVLYILFVSVRGRLMLGKRPHHWSAGFLMGKQPPYPSNIYLAIVLELQKSTERCIPVSQFQSWHLLYQLSSP